MPDFRRVVSPPGLWEQPPPTLQPAAGGSHWEAFVRLVLRPLWGWRLELAAIITAVVLWRFGAKTLGPPLAALVVLVLGLGAYAWPGLRRRILLTFHRAHVRRRWSLAVRHAGLATHNDRVPRPHRIEAVPAGDRMKVRIPAGSSVSQLVDAGEKVAAFLRIREVRVVRDRTNAGMASVVLVRRDPLSGGPAIQWPGLHAARLSLMEQVPIAVDEAGALVKVLLLWRNMLIGGEPGAGKSVLLSILVAIAALDPSVRLTLLDGKLVELAPWARCAHRSVGIDVHEAIEVLKDLRHEMDARYRWMLDQGLRKLDPTDEMPLHVVACDELAHYTTTADTKVAREFSGLMRDLVSRGRAAGIIVIAATQKPSHDVVPTSLRDLFGFRLALRCSTREASDTILGSGWASQGYSAATIDAADRGVGYLLHEGGEPVRIRACYLSDDDLKTLAARAEALRGGHGSPDALAAVLPITNGGLS